LDPLFDDEIGKLRVDNPLKALLVLFVMKEGTAKSITSAQQIVKTILEAEAGYELIIFSGKRGDTIKSGQFPNQNDIKKAWEQWTDHCFVAKQSLAATEFGRIHMEKLNAVEALPEAEKLGWSLAIEESRWALELVRAKSIHKAEELMEEPRVLVGDSLAVQLATALPGSGLISADGGMAGPESDKDNDSINIGNLAGVVRALNKAIFTTKVQAVVVFMGRDSLVAGETVDNMMHQAQRVLQLLLRFRHIHIFWIPPSYVHEAAQQHEELVGRMQQLISASSANFIWTTTKGRSFLELWRFGDTFNQHNITPSGAITENGLKFMRAYLLTQVEGFPDDKALGISPSNRPIIRPRGSDHQQHNSREIERRRMHPSFARGRQRHQYSDSRPRDMSPIRKNSSRH
jgi:hypothetical protein